MKKAFGQYLLVLFYLAFSIKSNCQTTISPYSILGIGDMETKDFGRWFGMSSAGTALKSNSFINSSNPASLIGLDKHLMHFDIASRTKFSIYSSPNAESDDVPALPDLAIRRLTFAIRPRDNWAIAFGLKPFSSVNYYFIQTNTILDTKTELTKVVDGSGGTHQFYGSFARKINEKWSVGVTASYLFGSLIRNTQYYSEDLTYNIERNETDMLNTLQLQGGVQYSGKLSDKISQHFGLTVSTPATLKRNLITEYKEQDKVVRLISEKKENFSLPLSLNVGYALQFNNKITLSADLLFSNWKKQAVDYPNSYTHPSQRVSFGFEYSKKISEMAGMREKWYLQFGISGENNYFYVDGKPLNTVSVSFGAGKNFTRAVGGYFGLELGSRGDKAKSKQISEGFSQIILGLTLKEFWYNTRRYRRYD